MSALWSGRLKYVFIAAVALVFAASACGGSDKGGGGGSTKSNDQGAGAPSDAAPAAQQVLNLRLTGEPKGLDPQRANFSTEITIIKQLFSALFSYDENLNVVPDLASEMPTGDNGGISKDGKTYTIKLRDDVSFTNGRKITATDVVYSMQRELDPNIAGPYASNYYSIVGAKEYNTALGTKDAPKTPSAADLDKMKSALGISAKDEKTVVFTLTAPAASFLQQLAIWPAAVVPKEVIEKFGDKWTEAGNLIGSGPFTLKEWAHSDHITLVANPNWHRAKVILQQINIKMIEDDATAYAAYLAGDLDTTGVPPANRKEVMSPASPLNKELVQKTELTTFALQFNNQEKPFDNPKVRAAFGTAIDRKAFVDGVLQGVGNPTTTWIPNGMPGYDNSVGKKYEVDAAKAKQLLADAGFPNGQGLPKVSLMIRASDTNRLVAQFFQDQLKKNLGVDMDVDYVDSATYQGRFTKSQFQLVFGGWGADWPYPDNWVDEHFSKGGSHNQYQYNDPKVDDLITKVKAETDQKKQLELYAQIQKTVIDDDAGIVPIYNRAVFLLVKPKVKNLIITGLDGEIRGDYNFWKTYIAKS